MAKKLSVALEIDIPYSDQIVIILKIKYALPFLIRNVAPEKSPKIDKRTPTYVRNFVNHNLKMGPN